MRQSLRTLTALSLVLAASGCRSTKSLAWNPADHAYAPPVQTTLRPGSVVELRFYYTPELDVAQTVLPDGTVSLPLVGNYSAAGKSPRQVERELTMLYSRELLEPELSVIVQGLPHQAVAIGGEVENPGRIEMPDSITVLEAVLQAGGPLRASADVRRVVVVREEGGRRQGYLVDLAPALRGESAAPFYLHPQDMVFVPPTRVTMMNQWVEQYINKMVPQFGFTFAKDVGDGARIGIDTSRAR